MTLHAWDAVPLPAIDPSNRLLADYLAGVAGLLPRDTPPSGARPGAHHAVLADALVAYQRHLDAPPEALASAARLADPATPVVTVGQQPGLLGGPLYTLYKALTALAAARDLGGVAVFWLGADDDDRAEIDHTALWGPAGTVHRLTYPAEAGAPGMLVGDLPITPYGDALLDEVAPLLDGQPYGDAVLALLRETLAGSHDFGDWSARILARVCGPLGLVICDPRLPALRVLAGEIIARELASPLATTRLLNARAHDLHTRGYAPALTKPADVCNAFLLRDGRRHRITFADGRYAAAGETFAPSDLVNMAAEQPGAFLPNAVLRPVVQEHLFGSSLFIAGPNELGYWAELPPVFDTLGVAMPPVRARAAATILLSPVPRWLQEWHASPFELVCRPEALRHALLAAHVPPAVRETFAAARVTVDDVVHGLAAVAGDIDATLAQSALATHQRMCNELERLEHKTLKAVERREGELVARLQRAREIVAPGHALQERVVGIPALLARAGLDIAGPLLALLHQQEGRHLFVEL